jgi:DNA-binding NtrC family response regulator
MILKISAMAHLSSYTNNTIYESVLSHAEKSSKSVLMRNILSKVLESAKLDMPVIFIGEIGTGKKRMARIVHKSSSRAPYPFYTFYCLNITNEEYEKAFREQLHLSDDHFVLKYNVIEKATRGILYLDQFADLPADLMLNLICTFEKGSEQLYRYSKAAKPRLILSVNME